MLRTQRAEEPQLTKEEARETAEEQEANTCQKRHSVVNAGFGVIFVSK